MGDETLKALEKCVEKITGLSIDKTREMTLCEMRVYFERKNGEPVKFVDYGRVVYQSPEFYSPLCGCR